MLCVSPYSESLDSRGALGAQTQSLNIEDSEGDICNDEEGYGAWVLSSARLHRRMEGPREGIDIAIASP